MVSKRGTIPLAAPAAAVMTIISTIPTTTTAKLLDCWEIPTTTVVRTAVVSLSLGVAEGHPSYRDALRIHNIILHMIRAVAELLL